MKTSPSSATETLGEAFTEALARKDFDEIATPLHPEIDFRGLTPRRDGTHPLPARWSTVLELWFEPAGMPTVRSSSTSRRTTPSATVASLDARAVLEL